MNLYEINSEIVNAWEACADPETGEINDELFAKFEELKIEREEKIENIALWIKDLRAEAVKIKNEIKALTDRAKAEDNKADRLERYLESALNGEKFSTPRVIISWRKSERVECSDIGLVPFDYLRYAEPTLDKIAIKKALKEGKEIAGCSLSENNSMSIK